MKITFIFCVGDEYSKIICDQQWVKYFAIFFVLALQYCTYVYIYIFLILLIQFFRDDLYCEARSEEEEGNFCFILKEISINKLKVLNEQYK